MTTATERVHRGRPQLSPAGQDYLKAIYHLQPGAGSAVKTQHLADHMGVSGPSATNTIKRLAALGLLRHVRYHGAVLTKSGELAAREIMRHHRLLERYLVEYLGFRWDAVHAEADRLEHHISEELEARLAAVLGYPAFDSQVRLNDLAGGESGEIGIVQRVPDDAPEQPHG